MSLNTSSFAYLFCKLPIQILYLFSPKGVHLIAYQFTGCSCCCSVDKSSRVQLFVTPRTAARQSSLFLTVYPTFLKLTFTDSMTPSNHLILCHPLLLPPSIFPSIRVFSNESGSSHQVAKVLELPLQHQSFQ